MIVIAKASCWHGILEWNEFINTCYRRVDLVSDKKDIFAILPTSTGSPLFEVPLILRTFAISSEILRLESWVSYFT